MGRVMRPSSCGYDIRVGDEFKIFTNINNTAHRSQEPRSALVRRRQGRRLHRSTQLVRARPYHRVADPARHPDHLPRANRTYAQLRGSSVNVTPFEPEWEGDGDAPDICNTTPLPQAKIYANEGMGALLPGGTSPAGSHADKKGKYLKQRGVTLPRPPPSAARRWRAGCRSSRDGNS